MAGRDHTVNHTVWECLERRDPLTFLLQLLHLLCSGCRQNLLHVPVDNVVGGGWQAEELLHVHMSIVELTLGVGGAKRRGRGRREGRGG